MLLFLRFDTVEVLLFLGLVLFVIAIPIILFVVIFNALRKNTKSRAAWQQISREMNLTMPNPKQLLMFGEVDGVDVQIRIGTRQSGGGEDRHTEFFTYATSKFPHSLRFLLNINSPRNFLSSSSMNLGQANFDKIFTAECYHQDVLRRLLLTDFPSNKTQNLMGDLMLADQTAETISISDEQVYLETDGQVTESEIVRQMLENAANLAKRFFAAREIFPLAEWETETLDLWQKTAHEKGLSLDQKSFAMNGTVDGFHLTVELKTDAKKWQTVLVLKFPQSLSIGLKIMPDNAIHKAFAWLGVQDIDSGNKQFDDAFIVKAENVVAAKQKLQPDFCNQLFVLCDKTSKFIIDDSQIAITFDDLLRDENILKGYIAGIVHTAKLLLR
jgi:hypothetical protein